jgi:hypothetical protein
VILTCCLLSQRKTRPPSTASVCPVSAAASSRASIATTAAVWDR